MKPKRKKCSWGGARPGAGRKKRYPRTRVDHAARFRFSTLTVLHVTLRLRKGLPTLRTPEAVQALAALFARAVEQERFAPALWSLQRNHIHMVVEAASTDELSRGMRSLGIRIAKTLNKLWGRKGSLFEDRYFARPVEGLLDLRNTLRYVLLNHKKHGSRSASIDWASSGPWFDGWAERPRAAPPGPRPVAPYRSILLRDGLSMGLALISVHEQPAGPFSYPCPLEA